MTHGRAAGLVVPPAADTELGQVATLISEAEARATPLQRRLAAFGKRLSIVVLAICAVIFAIGVLRGEPLLLMALTAISLAVAAIPEALPAVVTVLLALGARRLVAVNALVRRLPSVETLGSVSVICSDKTGTLTLNRMRLREHRAWGVARRGAVDGAGAVQRCGDRNRRLGGRPHRDRAAPGCTECWAGGRLDASRTVRVVTNGPSTPTASA